MLIRDFQEIVWAYYYEHAQRSMPWRDNTDAYWVLVSEIMLQQTQVDRVIPKFEHFIALFPSLNELANAPLSDVLRAWSGLGYNRRAKFLHQSAKVITQDFKGNIPNAQQLLEKLPGIGPNTASAIRAYAFNEPVVFIETNIRTVFMHYFFSDDENIDDKEILKIVEKTLDTEYPREWYWALMDHGAFLKKQGVRNHRSKQYKKQSTFEGSDRQIRGKILKLLSDDQMKLNLLERSINDSRFERILRQMKNEGFVIEEKGDVRLSD